MFGFSKIERGDQTVTSNARGRFQKSKILIHGMNFFPEFIGVGKYTGDLAFSLAKRGHSVEVVTAPPHYPGWSVAEGYNRWGFRRETIKGVSVLRCPILTKAGGGGLWRALAPLSFALFAAPVVFCRILFSRPDVVLCVEPTLFSAPAALLAGKLVRARTVLHIQDLEMDAAFDMGHLKSPVLKWAATAFERTTLRGFDLLVTISQKMRDALLQKGAPAKNTVVLRNWVDLDAIRPLPADTINVYREELGLSADKFVTLYSGHMGKKQALDVVLAAAVQCVAHERLHFVIAGEGPMKAELIAQYGHLTNVSFMPLQPVERFNELLNMADLHVLPQSKAAGDLVLPSKLGGMLASGRPVIATVEPDTELAQILDGSALSVPAEQPAALADAIIAASSEDLSTLAENGLRLAFHLSGGHILPSFESALVGPMPRHANPRDALLEQASAA